MFLLIKGNSLTWNQRQLKCVPKSKLYDHLEQHFSTAGTSHVNGTQKLAAGLEKFVIWGEKKFIHMLCILTRVQKYKHCKMQKFLWNSMIFIEIS